MGALAGIASGFDGIADYFSTTPEAVPMGESFNPASLEPGAAAAAKTNAAYSAAYKPIGDGTPSWFPGDFIGKVAAPTLAFAVGGGLIFGGVNMIRKKIFGAL